MKTSLRFLKVAVSVEDLQKASYKCSDLIVTSIEFDKSSDELVLILESINSEMKDKQFDRIVKNLQVEINDQSLRRKINDETANTRNLILAHTFSNLTKEK